MPIDDVYKKHTESAMRCNFALCGCDYCEAVRDAKQPATDQPDREPLDIEYENCLIRVIPLPDYPECAGDSMETAEQLRRDLAAYLNAPKRESSNLLYDLLFRGLKDQPEHKWFSLSAQVKRVGTDVDIMDMDVTENARKASDE